MFVNLIRHLHRDLPLEALARLVNLAGAMALGTLRSKSLQVRQIVTALPWEGPQDSDQHKKDQTDMVALHDQIFTLFREKLNLDVPSADMDLLDTGILDSLHFVELVLHLEQEFGTVVSLDDFEIEHFCSIAKIARFVANHK